MNEVEDLLQALVENRFAEEELALAFARWWSEHDPQGHELLDSLAAAAHQPDALALLLRLVDDHQLSRPAIRRVLIDETDVADAEQATLAVVGLRVGSFEGRARFTTWLHQIALNESRMLVRSRERRPATPIAELPAETAYLARLSTLVAQRDALERAVAELPEASREVFVLREGEGLSYDEIAMSLAVPVGTVRSRLNRARAALAQTLSVP